VEIFKNVFFDEITSSDISISATILNYLSKLLDYEKKEWLVNDPYEYAKFCIHTMFVIRMLEKDIDQIDLTQKERSIVEMIKKYKFKELVEPYEKNYVRFSVWKNRNGTLVYKLSDYRQKVVCEPSWEQVYSYLVLHPQIFPEIKKILLKTAEEKNLIKY